MKKREKRRIAAAKRGWDDLSSDEKRAVKRLMNDARTPALVVNMLVARSRTIRRRDSDRATDAERRILIGARVPREFGTRCRVCADALGVSLYRFTADALARECERVERMLNVEKSVEN